MATVTERTVQRTAYPHIVKIDGVCGGSPIVEGTRIGVHNIVNFYFRGANMSVEELVADWSALTPAQVFAALAYYHDNREEIDRIRHENSYEYWKEHYAKSAPGSPEVASE